MVKPNKSLLILVYLGIFLTTFHFLPDEILIYENQKIKIPKITQLFVSGKKNKKAEISETAKNIRKELANNKNSKTKKSTKGQAGKKNADGVYIPFVPDSLKLKKDLKIQYPKGKDDILFSFFKAIDNLEIKNELIRVIHYGDSQLEGDRITAFLRDKFQETFGGCGVGVVGIVDKLHSRSTIFQKSDQNWTQHMMYAAGYRRTNSKYYGILGDYYTFYIPPNETNLNNRPFQKTNYKFKPRFKTDWTKTSVTYQKFPNATPNQSKVENVKVLYRSPEAPFELTVQAQGDSIKKVEIPKAKDFGIFEYKLNVPFESVQVTFAAGSKSPQVYGVALDCNKGITFDNVPLRGSSGIEFSRTDAEHLRKQYKDLNVKFLILQFGVNIVPNPSSSYKWYEDLFYKQLKFLKGLKKGVSILVVGVSDMSRRSATGGFESYPNIEKIKKAQRNAAFRAGCAFWDLHEAMGGKNSMPSWVQEGLANRDYTHFSNKGAQVVSEMLYKALLSEYDRYNQLHH